MQIENLSPRLRYINRGRDRRARIQWVMYLAVYLGFITPNRINYPAGLDQVRLEASRPAG